STAWLVTMVAALAACSSGSTSETSTDHVPSSRAENAEPGTSADPTADVLGANDIDEEEPTTTPKAAREVDTVDDTDPLVIDSEEQEIFAEPAEPSSPPATVRFDTPNCMGEFGLLPAPDKPAECFV